MQEAIHSPNMSGDCCRWLSAVSRDSSQTDVIKELKAVREESKVGFFPIPC